MPTGARPDREGDDMPTRAQGLRHMEKVWWLQGVVERRGRGCRDWPWATNNKGYAVMRWEGRLRKVGHIALELDGRSQPSPDAIQLHSCDRPVCVAPWHLRWGTHLQNRADCAERGREVPANGIANGNAKLTDEAVRAIRAAVGRTHKSLAAEYGVHRTIIGKIRNGRTWRHVA